MSLELVNEKTLWDPGATDLTDIATSGSNRLLLPDHTVSASTTTIAPTQWHKIDINGGDYLLIKGKSSVTSVTGGTAITSSEIRCGALAVYDDEGFPFAGPLFGQATNTTTDLGTAATGHDALMLARVSSGGAATRVDAADFNNGTITTNGFLAIPDGTDMAADDLTQFSAWIGELAFNTQPTSASTAWVPKPTVSGMNQVWLGMRQIWTLTTATSAVVFDAAIKAYVFKDVQSVDKKDRRNPGNAGRFTSIGAHNQS